MASNTSTRCARAAKAVIKTALKAASDLIKKGFGEGKAETSNISAQIDDAVNNQIKNAKARAGFTGQGRRERRRRC